MRWMILFVLVFPITTNARVVCRSFDVNFTATESEIVLQGINTNLPDNTIVEVRIEGTAKTENKTYRSNYYKARQYLSRWSFGEPIVYDVPRDGYKLADEGITAKETITFHVTVPFGQVNHEFGFTNQKLIGCGAEKAVGKREIDREWVLVKREIKLELETRPQQKPQDSKGLDSKQQIEFTGSVANQVSQIAAVMGVAALKGKDCEWAIKVSREMEECADFLDYVTEGGPYDQATTLLQQLNINEADGVTQSELNDMVQDANKVMRYKHFALIYLQSE